MTGINVYTGAALAPVKAPWYWANGWNKARQALVYDGAQWVRVWPPNPGPAMSLSFSPSRTSFYEGESVQISCSQAGAIPEWTTDGGQTWRRLTSTPAFPFYWTARKETGNLGWRAYFPGSDSQAPSWSQGYPVSVGDAAPLTIAVTGTGFTEAERHQDGNARFTVTVTPGSGADLPYWNAVRVEITRPNGEVYQAWAESLKGRASLGINLGGFWGGTWKVRVWIDGGYGYERSGDESGQWIVQVLNTYSVTTEHRSNGLRIFTSGKANAQQEDGDGWMVRAGVSGDYSFRAFLMFGAVGKPRTGAWAVGARLKMLGFINQGDTSGPKVWHLGWHSLASLPSSPSLSQAGVHNGQWTSQHPQVGADGKVPVRTIPAYSAAGNSFWDGIANGSFRGLVAGGQYNNKDMEYALSRAPWTVWIDWKYQVWEDVS